MARSRKKAPAAVGDVAALTEGHLHRAKAFLSSQDEAEIAVPEMIAVGSRLLLADGRTICVHAVMRRSGEVLVQAAPGEPFESAEGAQILA